MTAPARPAAVPDVAELLDAVAGWGIGGAADLGEVRDVARAQALVAEARAERLTGIVSLALDAGALVLPEREATAAHDAHRAALVWSLELELRLVGLLDRLDGLGLGVAVLKGPAAAHLDVPDPAMRPFADLDLLVPADDLGAVVAALGAEGLVRRWPERRPGFDRRFAKSVTLRDAAGVEVDLHRTLVDGVAGARIPLDEVWQGLASFELGGRTVPCLPRPQRVVHAAYHLLLGSPSPRRGSLRDLAGHLTDPRVDLDEVVAVARRWRGEPVLAQAVELTCSRLGLDPDGWVRWARSVVVERAEQARIERQRREGSGLGRAKLDLLVALPGMRDRLAYLHALAVPSAAHRRSRTSGDDWAGIR